MGILEAFYSLGSKINKVGGKQHDMEIEEGVVSEKISELSIGMKNEELIELTKTWYKNWIESEVYSEWKEMGEENEKYWKGEQHDQPKVSNKRQIVDNVIFEGLETYLPQITRRNPDPMVVLSRREDQNDENIKYAAEIQKEVAEIADEIVLRLKLKKIGRHWAIYLLGAMKLGWDLDKDIPTAKVVRPTKLILDPDSTVDEEGYTGKYIGEFKKMQAGELISTLQSVGGEKGFKKLIEEKIKNNDGETALGTEIGFIEWWTQEYMCWTMDDRVLLKRKNPHWNYDSEEEAPYSEDGQPQLDEEGNPLMEEVEGFNHLPVPDMPYVLLSVFNLGKHPVDETSLISQNLSNQDTINKRIRQIDRNADSMNGAIAVSLARAGLTQAQAEKITTAIRSGGVVSIPDGSVRDAIEKLSTPPLPPDVYVQLQDVRSRTRDIFGTRGSTPAGLESEKTVRGKIQNRMLDTDRIGGGFSEYLEQAADRIYNWFVQLLYVYDERYNTQPHPKIRVGVKEGSLLPKDSVSLANQAMELAGQNRMSLIDLYKALDYPNPEEMAANVWLEANAPQTLFANDSRVQQVLQQQSEAAGQPGAGGQAGGVRSSVNFKDLPPEGQSQLMEQMGIKLHPEAIVAYSKNQLEDSAAQELAMEMSKRSATPTQ